ncbi:MAG: hypothetical protein HQL03_02535, partial [Nitrospirae bacterium]|nr:hypothetical protein [Nitrospirota bacterium]
MKHSRVFVLLFCMLSREEHRRFNTRVVYGDTATKIVEVADEENCDL